ncbi:hypothetical protein E3N88_20647 [Mikania micrantha]|uniref:Uncharacterized protein n=1 Tax=Mikania micrantha TaxID=192012 RepID=A0A5N6NI06_9ASTR|nr:hypothetical protein E3N88_20647 [Mikania micrantha]
MAMVVKLKYDEWNSHEISNMFLKKKKKIEIEIISPVAAGCNEIYQEIAAGDGVDWIREVKVQLLCPL